MQTAMQGVEISEIGPEIANTGDEVVLDIAREEEHAFNRTEAGVEATAITHEEAADATPEHVSTSPGGRTEQWDGWLAVSRPQYRMRTHSPIVQ